MSKKTGSSKYYIRIPTENGSWQFVEIDLSRATKSTFTEFFERVTSNRGSRDGGSEYMSAHGLESLVGSDIDTKIVDSGMNEVLDTMMLSLDSCGDVGRKMNEEFVKRMRAFSRVFELIGQGKPSSAMYELQDIMWNIQAVIVELASDLNEANQACANMESSSSAIIESLDVNEHTLSLYETWAEAAIEILEKVDELARYETRLQNLKRQTASSCGDVNTALTKKNKTFGDALVFLIDPEVQEESCFALSTSEYLQTDGASKTREQMSADIQGARTHIASCEDVLKSYLDAWSAIRESMNKQSLDDIQKLDIIIDNLDRNIHRYLNFRDCDFSGRIGPHMIGKNLISAENFARCEQVVADARWRPQRVRERLRSMSNETISALGPKPQFPNELKEAIDSALENIRAIERKWAEESLISLSRRRPNSSAISDEKAAWKPPAQLSIVRVRTSENEKKTEINTDEAQKLYELIMCAAFVVTCKPAPFALSNVRALANVVKQMTIMTDEAIDAHLNIVKKMIDTHEDMRAVPKIRDAMPLFESGKCVWIKLTKPPRAVAHLKLTKAGGRIAESLMKKYGLTYDFVRNAYCQKREISQERYRQRISAEEDGSESSAAT